ncbi:MAG: cytochrome P460 family protein [Kordiimonadaceae bacterium]|nr:cytochrome P460 family protein [Kordiimonadaceae bacterium]
MTFSRRTLSVPIMAGFALWGVVAYSGMSVACQGTQAQAADQSILFPYNYRNWTHVKTQVWGEGHPLFEAVGGMHHIYANDKALEGYRTGVFADGSQFAFDLLDVDVTGGATIEASRKALFVMIRDQLAFAETGGWGYEGFAGDDRATGTVGSNAQTACHSCHLASEETSYVVSTYRD